ncbi:protein amnionless [Ambystoma mexicanum]|uniref:protein amnionless n=1 Tax=Ambystoma mexicanum TaxID=8296 RepID=UPI0037E7D102
MEWAPLLPVLLLCHISSAMYKQWIPNTNFENPLNWDRNQTPCALDAVYFENRKAVSVYVQSTHSLSSMYLPQDGEFILAPGAGFAVSDALHDAGCDRGSDITFKNGEAYNWMDPEMWHAAMSTEDLENGKYLFSVDEERVPCQYDDAVFQPRTSFQVNVEPSEGTISLKSISILGQRFDRQEDFENYMKTKTGKMQFHGSGSIKVTNARCTDRTGCLCGNTRELQNICSALKQHSENKCPGVTCKDPLKPIGHCCEICGATVSLEYTPNFDIETYRNRLLHGFLSLAKYDGVRIALNKVLKSQSFLGVVPRQAVPEIQIVIVDDKNGSETGTAAQLLANDIMGDIKDHGASFGIVKGTVQIATGSHLSGLEGSSAGSGLIATCVVVVLLLLLTGVLLLLYRKHGTRFQTWSITKFWRRASDLGPVPGRADKGFDNPIFDVETHATTDPPGLYSGEEALKGIPLQGSGIFFVNPLYDENDSTI